MGLIGYLGYLGKRIQLEVSAIGLPMWSADDLRKGISLSQQVVEKGRRLNQDTSRYELMRRSFRKLLLMDIAERKGIELKVW